MAEHSLKTFMADWGYQTEKTLEVFKMLTDETLDKEFHPDVRSTGRLAWHIVQTIREMMERTGLKIEGPEYDSPPPTTVKEIIEAYQTSAASLKTAINENWTDATLDEVDDMYGMEWPRRMTLQALVGHEIHHRGQLTVVMRLAGLSVPGVMGPSKEEWPNFGMEAPKV